VPYFSSRLATRGSDVIARQYAGNSNQRKAKGVNRSREHDLEELLGRAQRNDQDAVASLMTMHRDRLRRMVAVRMHEQLSARVDPSDVVQDAMAEATKVLPVYLDGRPIPFYPWLRRFVWEKLVQLHRHHLDAQQRSVRRETARLPLPEASGMQLVERLIGSGTSPSEGAIRKERRDTVHHALEQLSNHDREVLVLLYLEQLSMHEASEVLGISRRATNMRHLRALKRLKRVLPIGRLDGT
jgi:RNA polymerase sigma-70 factor (ECF subfamily)